MKRSYDAFARFYDAVQGEGTERADVVRGLIERHHPSARTVLELACGTGSIIQQLRPQYEVTGLDASPAMLAVAAEKLPGVRLIEADMREFDLGRRFDVVVCVYDSINHLLDFGEWDDVFARAHEHLNDGGIFLFDVNTERWLGTLAARPPLVQWFGDGNLLLMDVRDDRDGVVVWDIRVFEQVDDAAYRLHAEEIREAWFPRRRIEDALRQRFRRVSAHDPRRKRPTAASERIYFVAAA